MHPNNPFFKDYDFDKLISVEPKLKEFVFTNKYKTDTINFANNLAVKLLNKALLKMQYGISWDIPVKNLCPPIPGRLDYLLYVQDLIEKKDVRMLDIGTGANLIYPILGSCHFNWQTIGTEVDKDAIKNAEWLIKHNSKLSKVKVRQQKFKNVILKNIIQPSDTFDVIVCNPPFYKSSLEAQKQNKRKTDHLKLNEEEKLNFGGQSNELWYKGGEVAFISKMIQESKDYANQVQWFTSLISNKDHVSNLVRLVKELKPLDFVIVEMGQGNKQSRFIAWSWLQKSKLVLEKPHKDRKVKPSKFDKKVAKRDKSDQDNAVDLSRKPKNPNLKPKYKFLKKKDR